MQAHSTRPASKPALVFALGLVVGYALCPRGFAQTTAGLQIQTYAGLTITGAVGIVYSIEYVGDLAQTNNAGAWRCLEFLQLPDSPYLWADKSAPTTGKRFYRAVAMEAPRNMAFIPPGTFRMGSPTSEVGRQGNEGPETAVLMSRGFWIGKYEVTQGEYLALMGTNPSYFRFIGDPNLPVETVSWNDATNYCGRLTEQERTAGRIPTNSFYRLPTEAEWEYACRAWTSTRFSYGDDSGCMIFTNQVWRTVGAYTNLTSYAWHGANSGGRTHPVGQKLPNPWGLYDMYGNLWEWCHDWLADYPGGIAIDPQGPAAGSLRAYRGGDWSEMGFDCRSAVRHALPPEASGYAIGFRIVLTPGPP